MIVKLDRVMLKLKIVVGLIFSVLSLWILCPELIRGSLRENPVKQFLAVIVLFWLLLSIVILIDGIVNLRGHGKLLELDDNSLTYYGQAFGRKTFDIPLSEIEFVKKAWTTRMEDIERSSMLRLMIKRDTGSCLFSSKMARQLLPMTKNLGINHGRNVPMSKRCE